MQKKQILIAAGGTGGHLFPAQALAEDLQERGSDPLFAGAGLQMNRFFDRDRFRFYDVLSATPFGGKKALLKAPWVIFRGVMQSLKILKKENVSLVVGFGSFHSFPLLMAAKLKRVPLVLFEPNAYPGRVNRLFSKGARFTALQFTDGHVSLKGDERLVSCLGRRLEKVEREHAAAAYQLDMAKKTLLVFGGSQGALTINQYLFEMAPQLSLFSEQWQILHFVGKNDDPLRFRAHYETLGIQACVKAFEEKMATAWSLADLVISRSGASTLAEQRAFAVPSLFIPYPYASDDHQTKNAAVIERFGGGITIKQGEGSLQTLLSTLTRLLRTDSGELKAMAGALSAVKETPDQQHFSSLIMQVFKDGRN